MNKILLKVFLFTILLNVGMYFITLNLIQRSILVVDIKGINDSFMSQAAMLGNKVTQEQLANMNTRFHHAMDESIREYAKGDKVILVSPAVVSGGTDITQEVKRKIADKMRGK